MFSENPSAKMQKTQKSEKKLYDLYEKLLNSAKPVLSVIGPNAKSLKKLEISTILN